MKHIVNLSMHGVDSSLYTTLLSRCLRIDCTHLLDSISCFRKLSLSLALSSLSRIQKRAGFLHLTLKSICSTLRETDLFHHILPSTLFFLIATFSLTKLSLISLDGFLSFHICLIGMIKGNFQFIDVTLNLLLDSQCLSFSLLLRFKACLDRVNGSSMVFASIVKLFLLFRNLSINILLYLTKLQLGSQNLIFFLFEGALSFFQCSLQLFFLHLKAPSLLIKFMDRSSTITKLIKQIFDFIS